MSSPTAIPDLAELPVAFAAPSVAGWADDELLTAQRDLSALRRRVDAAAATVAAEIARRSRRDLGSQGLAQRLGARTPELLVQRVAGTTSREAQTMVRVGALMAAPSPFDPVGAAAREARISLDAANAIRSGLGADHDHIPAAVLSSAAESLVRQASELTVEKLASRARELRAELDEEHVRDRERELRESRYLRLIPQSDGMTRLSGLLDPESAAIVVAAFDGATSPRRGGPRFVDPDAIDDAERMLRDERTTEQLALDSFVELIRIGTAAGAEVVGAHRPAVRVHVARADLARRAGSGHFEGQPVPISVETVERHACSAGIVPILFDDDGQSVNVGRNQRLFTARQRIGLAARDGGCRFPGCDRPPSWCEAHHIDEWQRDHGRTDIADGVLLCRHHHLLVHDNGWRVTRTGAEYFLVPPRTLDPTQAPIPALTKNPIARRAREQRRTPNRLPSAERGRTTGAQSAGHRDRRAPSPG